MIICLNGKFLPKNRALIPAVDNGVLYGDAFYDTMRTYDGKILELSLHLKRITKSAKLIGIKLPWGIKNIEKWLEKTARLNKLNSGRVRITITRGENGFNFISCKKPTLIITTEKIVTDNQIYNKGVQICTLKLSRQLPEIKMVGLTTMIEAYRKILPKKIYEAILVGPSNYIKEGASTNIFIIKNNILYTPKKEILNGLTRQRVILIAKSKGIRVRECQIKKTDIYSADEIFLTNRPREIIPAISVDGKKIKNGEVGLVTKNIMQWYKEYVKDYFSRY